MKQATLLAGLAAGLAAANAHFPHQHHHEHVPRGADGTVTTYDVTTVWDYVTVTAGQNLPSSAPVKPGEGKAGVQAGNQVKAQANQPIDPQAIQSSLIAEQNSKIAQQESINAHQESINNQGVSTGPPPGPNPPSAPTTTTQPQVAPSYPTSIPTPTATGGAQGGPGGVGQVNKGYGTYYGAEGGYGSCGTQLSDDGHTIALASSLMGQNKAYCGHTVTITLSNGQSVQATVEDTCPGCDDDPWGHIDIVQGWAHQLDPNIDVAGHVDISWVLH